MKGVKYRNKIEAMLGVTPKDVEDIARRSRPHQQRVKQLRRSLEHKMRKAAP